MLKVTRRTDRALVIICLVAVVVGIILRFYRLGFPDKQVFDEVYFPVFAQKYLLGQNVYDVHPPLGKFFIAIGILLFGNNPIGWRIIPALSGVAVIVLLAALTWRLFHDKVTTLIIAGFVALDGMLLAYSRVGLMDEVLLGMTFLVFYLAVVARPRSLPVWWGLALGAAAAIKWPAIAMIVPSLWYLGRTRPWGKRFWLWLLTAFAVAAAFYIGVVYLGQVRNGNPNPWQGVWEWHKQAWDYHVTLTATHPWGSPWWSWPILYRPVLFLYDTLPDGKFQVMTTLGNPLVWWSSTIAVVGSLAYLLGLVIRQGRQAFQHVLTPLLLGYFACWLPWVGVKRVVFLYHYFPSYIFAMLILVYWLGQAWRVSRPLVVGYVFVVFCISLYFLPFAVGWFPLTHKQIRERTWVSTWF